MVGKKHLVGWLGFLFFFFLLPSFLPSSFRVEVCMHVISFISMDDGV
jgi:hypothetical protein